MAGNIGAGRKATSKESRSIRQNTFEKVKVEGPKDCQKLSEGAGRARADNTSAPLTSVPRRRRRWLQEKLSIFHSPRNSPRAHCFWVYFLLIRLLNRLPSYLSDCASRIRSEFRPHR